MHCTPSAGKDVDSRSVLQNNHEYNLSCHEAVTNLTVHSQHQDNMQMSHFSSSTATLPLQKCVKEQKVFADVPDKIKQQA